MSSAPSGALAQPLPPPPATADAPRVMHFQQRVSHANSYAGNGSTFSQRYLVDDAAFQPGAPIFAFTGAAGGGVVRHRRERQPILARNGAAQPLEQPHEEQRGAQRACRCCQLQVQVVRACVGCVCRIGCVAGRLQRLGLRHHRIAFGVASQLPQCHA